jgi:tetratricopeptide (TPR) repeat protein
VPAAPIAPGEAGAARVLWAALAALALARALTTLVPTMWAWSLNLMRFVDPVIGWGTWLLAAAALVPPLARRARPAWSALGDALAGGKTLPVLAWTAGAALLAWSAPDRLRFTGDFLLRQGTVEVAEQPARLFPQALPLDVLLHYALPRYLASGGILDANGAGRALGMLEAALLALLAAAFARTLALRGAAALAASSSVFFGGYLGMFTGFSKAFAEICLAVAAVGVYGLAAIREGRGLLPMGAALALGVALHRSALGLLPSVLFAWGAWLAAHGGGGGWRRPRVLWAMAVPLVALAVMVPRIVAVVRRWDALHFAPPAVADHGGVLAAAFSGSRAPDLANLMVMLAPLSPLLLALAPFLGAILRGSGREAALLVLLAFPFVAVMPFIHPAHGLVRDWDDFAAGGLAVSLLAAWALARCVRAPRHHWLAVPLTLAALVPALQWLAHNADVDRGFARVRALVLEPPARAPAERGTTWDFLGIRSFRLERWDDAAEAFARAAETSPSPRILQEWALAETMRRNYPAAREAYQRMLAKAPDNALGWLGLGTVTLHLGDYAEARRAAERLLELQPSNPQAFELLEHARRGEALRRPAPPSGSASPSSRNGAPPGGRAGE